MTFVYRESELNSLAQAEASCYPWADGSARARAAEGSARRNAVVAGPRPTVAIFSFGSPGTDRNPKPVELVHFAADRERADHERAERVVLTWQPACGQRNVGFVAERSADGRVFAPVSGLVAGVGTSAEPHAYTWTDVNAPTARTFYRLRQRDADGWGRLSAAVMVDAVDPKAACLALWPNPAADNVLIQLPPGAAVVEIFDALGRVVLVVPTLGAPMLDLPLALWPGEFVVRAGGEMTRLVVARSGGQPQKFCVSA